MLVTGDLDGATAECAGALAAREHAAARQVRPELPAGSGSAGVCAAALQRLCDSGHHGLVATGNGRIEPALCTAAWSCPAANANGRRPAGLSCPAKKHLPAVRRARLHQCCPAIGLGEPQWFYDLHGAIRELPGQNGDVPLLAGQALAATARSFEDIAEPGFCRPGQKPAEIDIIALADGRLIIGEAGCVPAFGSNKKASQAIAKLTGISDLLGTDEILLATTVFRDHGTSVTPASC